MQRCPRSPPRPNQCHSLSVTDSRCRLQSLPQESFRCIATPSTTATQPALGRSLSRTCSRHTRLRHCYRSRCRLRLERGRLTCSLVCHLRRCRNCCPPRTRDSHQASARTLCCMSAPGRRWPRLFRSQSAAVWAPTHSRSFRHQVVQRCRRPTSTAGPLRRRQPWRIHYWTHQPNLLHSQFVLGVHYHPRLSRAGHSSCSPSSRARSPR